VAKLSVERKPIYQELSEKDSNFLIPDYQRPYTWGDDECSTLWEDFLEFAIPEGKRDKFDQDSEYFLGTIVTFPNNKFQEVIDGQQRLTTIMLILRAFYDRFQGMDDEESKKTCEMIEKCLWVTDEFGRPNQNQLKISSEVATDDEKEKFLNILKTGEVDENSKDIYSLNFIYFQKVIQKFINEKPSYVASLAVRILNNCILLPIEAESQDTALRIFNTLNDRGLPLSDSDIFKTQLYNFYSNKDSGKEENSFKDQFIEDWKELEEKASE
jgi:uncharacterized protein with ParB-like and HNH nuclease domain